jgi:hypothetical protein
VHEVYGGQEGVQLHQVEAGMEGHATKKGDASGREYNDGEASGDGYGGGKWRLRGC